MLAHCEKRRRLEPIKKPGHVTFKSLTKRTDRRYMDPGSYSLGERRGKLVAAVRLQFRSIQALMAGAGVAKRFLGGSVMAGRTKPGLVGAPEDAHEIHAGQQGEHEQGTPRQLAHDLTSPDKMRGLLPRQYGRN